MSEVIKNEFKMMFNGCRVNRIRFLAFKGFFFLCLAIPYYGISYVLHDKVSGKIITALAICYLILDSALFLWMVKRRLNDTGRSLLFYFKWLGVCLLFIIMPTIFLYTNASLPAFAKLLAKLSYLIGIAFMLYPASVIAFYKSAPISNKYGSVPPKNNYFTISLALICTILLTAYFGYRITKTIEAISQIKHSAANITHQA